MTGAGVPSGRDLVANAAITLPAGAAQISGASFTIDIPAGLLPSQGRAFDAYGFNLWPRDASVPAGNAQIADFAPNDSNAIVSGVAAVPEPETYLLFAIGLLPVALGLRRERRRAPNGSHV